MPYTEEAFDAAKGVGFTRQDVQINKAVEIPAPTTYTMQGYTFLGWGKIDKSQSSGPNATGILDNKDLSDENLFLKWVVDNEQTGAGHYEAQLPKDKLTRDYYIVGYINGADVGSGTDNHANLSNYKIIKTSGKLSVKFDYDSYVFVKTPDNIWYNCEAYVDGTNTSATMKPNFEQKFFVPGGVQLTFELSENIDDDGNVSSITLSYTTGSEPSGDIAPLNLRAGEEELEWKKVTAVAADEDNPYQDLYAVWGGEFKVYHSGVEGGNVETYQITRANKDFDLTRYYVASRADTDPHAGEYKDSGFLYGGYYLDGGFTAPAMDDKGVPTAECAAYDGANWTWTTPVTDQPGNAITPKGGVTYYIKEVPASKYLQPYFHYTYLKESDPANQTILTAWLISDIDDAMYKETGFMIISDNDKANVCTQLTVQNTVGGASVVLKPTTIFRSKGVTKGFLSYLEVLSNGEQTLLKEGNKVVQYWVTPDGLIVTGTAARTYNALDTRANIKAEGGVTTEPVSSTIGVFSAPEP